MYPPGEATFDVQCFKIGEIAALLSEKIRYILVPLLDISLDSIVR